MLRPRYRLSHLILAGLLALILMVGLVTLLVGM